MTTAVAVVRCGGCETDNAADAQFCQGCGGSLYEPCGGCSAPVARTQRFCGKCGQDLTAKVDKRRAELEERLSDAVAAAKSHRFDDALAQIDIVASVDDHRLVDVAKTARAAREKIGKLAERSRSDADAKLSAAASTDDPRRIIALLSGVPTPLLTAEAKTRLRSAEDHVATVEALEAETRAALQRKDWPTAGSTLSQLIQTCGEVPDYVTLAARVADRIRGGADKLIAAGRFADAAEYLRSLPPSCVTDVETAKLSDVDDLLWLNDQFPDQPFATPTLGRLAVRLQKSAPQLPSSADRVERLKTLVRRPVSDPRHRFADWHTPRPSVLGGDVGLLAVLRCIDWTDHPPGDAAALLTTAAGLAFSGWAASGSMPKNGPEVRVAEPLHRPARSVAGSLRRKKIDTVWGLDIGTDGLRAVAIRLDDDGRPRCVGHDVRPFATPLSRVSDRDQTRHDIARAVRAWAADIDLDTARVAIGYPTAEVIHHFFRLPPVPAKQAAKLAETELKGRVPLAADDIARTLWFAGVDGTTTAGIPASAAITRVAPLKIFAEMIAGAGVRDPLVFDQAHAVVNVAALEFADSIGTFDADADDEVAAYVERDPTIALVDAGASHLRLTLVSRLEHWSGSVEAGGESLTSSLTRTTKCTRDEAEARKRSPWELERPAEAWPPLAEAMDAWRSRLVSLRNEAAKFSSRFDVVQTWATGGTSLTHDFIRQTLIDSPS